MRKSYFATENDYSFFGNGTLTKLLISFDCLFDGSWEGINTQPYTEAAEVLKSLRKLGYSLFLCDVPEKEEILTWLDENFDYDFTCNDYPTRYADLSDHWTEIMRNIPMRLCPEGNKNYNRTICFSGNWNEILEIIKENDILARTEHASNTYDDIDWNQSEEENGLSDVNGKQLLGGSYIPVEKLNKKTTELLNQIAIPETNHLIEYSYKPNNERWPAEILKWNVKNDIASKYGVSFVIEQGALYYRGTWIKVIAKAVDGKWQKLQKIVDQFCKDYGFASKKEISFITPYDLPWPEGQKKREEEDDDTDWFFWSPNDD